MAEGALVECNAFPAQERTVEEALRADLAKNNAQKDINNIIHV